jgi:hypothetical protein
MGLTKEYQRNYRYLRARAVYDYLAKHPCVDCGESDPVVLDFDHVRGQKFMNVKRMLSGTYSLKRIFEEIEKCDVRCANCHRRATAQRGGFFTYVAVIDLEPAPRGRRKSPCGTRGAYQHGCRCADCRKAHRIAMSNYRQFGRYEIPPAMLPGGGVRLSSAAS